MEKLSRPVSDGDGATKHRCSEIKMFSFLVFVCVPRVLSSSLYCWLKASAHANTHILLGAQCLRTSVETHTKISMSYLGEKKNRNTDTQTHEDFTPPPRNNDPVCRCVGKTADALACLLRLSQLLAVVTTAASNQPATSKKVWCDNCGVHEVLPVFDDMQHSDVASIHI